MNIGDIVYYDDNAGLLKGLWGSMAEVQWLETGLVSVVSLSDLLTQAESDEINEIGFFEGV